MTVSFELFGREFFALNGGSNAKIEGIGVSFMVECESQEELDGYWNRLADGGQEVACGWVTDRYGLAWQIIPKRLMELQADYDRERAQRAIRRDAEDDEDRHRRARKARGSRLTPDAEACLGCRAWPPPSPPQHDQPRPGSSSTGASSPATAIGCSGRRSRPRTRSRRR